MTHDSDLKRHIRHRMRHTGETYTQARTALLRREPAQLPDLSALSDDDRAFFIKTARAFFEGHRLKSIPLKRRARVVILLTLLARFEAGRRYTEAEVNRLLLEAFDDVASLRRELVNYGYLQREGGIYWVNPANPDRDATVDQEVPASEAAFLAHLRRGR